MNTKAKKYEKKTFTYKKDEPLKFGKFKGKTFLELPAWYSTWLISNKIIEIVD